VIAYQILGDAEKDRRLAERKEVIEGKYDLAGGDCGSERGLGRNGIGFDLVVADAGEVSCEGSFRVFESVTLDVRENNSVARLALFESANAGGLDGIGRSGFARFEELERHTDDVGVFRRKFVEDAGRTVFAEGVALAPLFGFLRQKFAALGIVRGESVALAAKGAASDLLAEKLGVEGADADDVSDGIGIPALGEHRDGDDAADIGTEGAALPDGVDDFAKNLGV